ncbi:Cof-type HAD-IIB family hydrolase [Mycoplasmopsis lipofaciens]|uniref:Cof-type HAD-IIB family hydrolase n=1 Tax=Mycoplasmopsis lipofaciens TaxID=114884 RepID=UPI0004880B9C|nr:Cof-type HAD-IIB family hydrolase [Mycoplasmopsis lipofaciens]
MNSKSKITKEIFDKLETFVFDMDGTLLNDQKYLIRENIDFINKLHKLNKRVIIATGRPIFTLKNYLEELNIKTPIICANGGIIHDNKSFKVKDFFPIDKDEVKIIFNFLQENNYTFFIYTSKKMLGFRKDKSALFKERNYKEILNKNEYQEDVKLDSFIEEGVCKFLINFKDDNEKIQLKNMVDNLKNAIGLISQKNLFDIISTKCSKGNAIIALSKSLKFNLEKTISFGDADNDISMFNITKYSYSPANSSNKAKKYSTFHSNKTNNENWIEEAFKSFI